MLFDAFLWWISWGLIGVGLGWLEFFWFVFGAAR